MITVMTKRHSNIELLRIVAMFFIMIGHFYFRSFQMPIYDDFTEHSLMSVWNVALFCIVGMGVDIFIVMSGWYGIQYKQKGLFKYLYQVSFILWLIFVLCVVFDISKFSISGIKICLGFDNNYWFIIGYMGLYLVSPVLNTFIEYSSKQNFQILLLSFYIFQCYYSWLSSWFNPYGGYSIILFSGIYLTAAYLRKYPIIKILKKPLLIWLLIVSFMVLFTSVCLWILGNMGRQIRNDNPLIILAAILFFLFFMSRPFYNKYINWLAASCFTVYIVHMNPFIYPFLKGFSLKLFHYYDGIYYGGCLLVFITIIYFSCVLFDQLRIFTWKIVCRLMMKS